ncbi:MAG: hypothetical protein CME64_07975 [Halobacteriovoraceae bacterium]|nr:hypothetical protein [Halobacteriovoraceae bacterium]|tara:strand:- start:141932 stop:143332 length:1401 start_codon:yes stop_codon:yes gene_type:complete
MKTCDALVIGAGMGGLAAAALWAQKGHKVYLVESHYSSGGCAGYFKRREGPYDVGATTLSGLRDGRPVKKVIDKLNLNIDIAQSDPGIVVHMDGNVINMHSDLRELSNEFKNNFSIDCHSTLKKWKRYEDALWKALDVPSNFPYLKFKELLSLFRKDTRVLLFNPQLFFKSFYDFMPKFMRESSDFVRFIDQLLLISTQQTSKTCPAFMGILGLFYPMDTYSISGGMRTLAKTLEKSIKSHGGEIFFKSPCERIVRVQGGYGIYTQKEVFFTKNLISNISPEVFNTLLEGPGFKQNKGKIWGANVAYLNIKAKRPIDNLYHQIHDQEGSLFFSISRPEADSLIQRITVSSHVDVDDYEKRDNHYELNKERFQKRVLAAFNKYLLNENIETVRVESIGTPLTFKHYTGRPKGEVGGLIHHSVFSLFRLMPNKAPSEDIYFVGDYTFPGQGIVSVFQSALNSVKNKSH